MSKMRNLEDGFPHAKWLNTHAGACKRIDKAVGLMGGDVDKYGFLYTIAMRSSGRGRPEYLPIAILGDYNRHLALFLCNQGIAVTSA